MASCGYSSSGFLGGEGPTKDRVQLIYIHLDHMGMARYLPWEGEI